MRELRGYRNSLRNNGSNTERPRTGAGQEDEVASERPLHFTNLHGDPSTRTSVQGVLDEVEEVVFSGEAILGQVAERARIVD